MDDDESSGDSGDEYVQDRPAAGAAKNKKRAVRRSGAGNEGVSGRKRVQKKRKRAQRTEEELKEMPQHEGAWCFSFFLLVSLSRSGLTVCRRVCRWYPGSWSVWGCSR